MTTLTLINSLPVVETLSLTASQIIINENSANNTLSRMTVGNFASEFLPTGELISNAGGTVAGVDLSTLFTLSSVGTDGNATLGLVQLSAGELLGNPTSGTNSIIGAGLTEFFDSNFGSIEGGLVYRGASAWLFLTPGTTGQVLTTNAEAGPPAWESVGVPVTDIIGTAPISVSGSGGTYDVSLIGSLGIELTDGSTTVAGATILTFEGASTLSGSGGHGTISIGGGGGGSLQVVGGSDTVTSVTEIIFDGATVTGSTGTATVSVGGGGSSWEITDGVNTVSSVTELIIDGGTVSGAGGTATLSISGGSGGGTVVLGDPTNGMSLVGRTGYQRPLLSAMTLIRSQEGPVNGSQSGTLVTGNIYDFVSGSNPIGPLAIYMADTGIARGAIIAHDQDTSSPFAIEGQVNLNSPASDPDGGSWSNGGICLYESVSNKMVLLNLNRNGNNDRIGFYSYDSTGEDITELSNINQQYGGAMFLRLRYNGGENPYSCLVSYDGITWFDIIAGQPSGGFFTGVPDMMGFFCYANSTDPSIGMSLWQLFASSLT